MTKSIVQKHIIDEINDAVIPFVVTEYCFTKCLSVVECDQMMPIVPQFLLNIINLQSNLKIESVMFIWENIVCFMATFSSYILIGW